ncbi:MAG: DUF1028 domain-containing protein [Planctomycetes bacterium]|nr:DUF1028 domain-containing protein [Planctomycetota bacterium]
MPSMRRALSFLLCLLLSTALPATWSIILIDTRTGEIAIASATCLTGFDLRAGASVVVVGKGAAAAQSFVDTSGQNRMLIFAQLQAGTSPQQILQLLAAQDPGHQTRQYGIVDVQGRALGFTGTGAGQWAGHLTGQIGTLVYAIQGNVLTGQPVITQAEQAIRNTPGDLADKLMAAMEASRLMGGDGRCSCPSGAPTACGSPPASFTKSADIGYMIVARPGDTDGVCNGSVGCATGSYYLNLNIAGQSPQSPDPVYQLRTAFLNWRLQRLLRPDHYLSDVALEPGRLLADGGTQATLRIALRDWRGVRIPYGGAQVTVTPEPGGTATVGIGAAVDHGDGTYSVPIGPSTTVGGARLRVTVNDGIGPVQLWPTQEIAVTSDSLWLSRATMGQAGGPLDLALAAGNVHAGRSYLVLASASGSTPGVQLPNLLVPLNPDHLTEFVVDWALTGALPGLFAALDGQGRARATVPIPPGVLQYWQGGALTFAFVLLSPLDFASNPAAIAIR